MPRRASKKSKAVMALSDDSSPSESKRTEEDETTANKKRKQNQSRASPAAARRNTGRGDCNHISSSSRKQPRHQPSPGLVAMFSPEDAVLPSDSDSSASFQRQLDFAKRKSAEAASNRTVLGEDDDDPDSEGDSSLDQRKPKAKARAVVSKPKSKQPKGQKPKRAPASVRQKRAAIAPKSKQKPRQGKPKQQQQQPQPLLKKDASDDESISIGSKQSSDSRSIILENEQLDDDDDDASSQGSYKPQFTNDGTGKRPVHSQTLQYAVQLLQEQGTKAASKVTRSLKSAAGSKQEAKRVQVGSVQHQTKIISRVRLLLRSTKVPEAYAKTQDPDIERMEEINQDREQDIDSAKALLTKLRQQRMRLEEELDEETERNNELQQRVERDKAKDKAHPLLLHLDAADKRAADSSDNAAASAPQKLRSAPKGTMTRLLLKLTK